MCCGGLALPPSMDITAFVLVFPAEDEADKYAVLPFFWMSEDNIFICTDPVGNIKPDKEKTTEKINGAVAARNSDLHS